MRTIKPAYFFGIGAAVAAVLVFACGFDPPEKNPNPPTGAGGACKAGPGEFPAANCDPSKAQCSASGICSGGKTSGCCKIEAKCGDQSTCMPMADNKGKSVLDLRMRRLNIAAPPTLKTTFIQNTVITNNLDLKANGKGGTPACGEDGNGAFNWLLKIDKSAGTLTTGGAPPVNDPFGKGYCFYRQKRGNIAVESVTGAIKFTGDTFDGDPVPKLNIPIFVNGDINNVVVLPLSDAKMKAVTVSPDGNCIGQFNPPGVTNDCTNDPTECQKWLTAGSLAAYITLEEADEVNVKDLQMSLCVVLTDSATEAVDHKCKREGGKIAYKGDYCSTSKQAGDCADSFWLAATFAASAATINDGADTPECQGKSSTPDAGSDAEAGATDGATDAPVDAPKDAPPG
jgi:hypothetical protein